MYMKQNFETIKETIQNRRTRKPQLMNGQKIADETVQQLLELANWAPTHGNTQPWYFFVYAGNAVMDFCKAHAELYLQNTSTEKFVQGTYDKLAEMGSAASHVIIACMKRGANPKIPVLEEIAAASCAVQNLLLGAEAAGIAAYWGSGGMAYRPEMKTHLQLGEEDLVLGIIYLGYTNEESKAGKRPLPVEERTTWTK